MSTRLKVVVSVAYTAIFLVFALSGSLRLHAAEAVPDAMPSISPSAPALYSPADN